MTSKRTDWKNRAEQFKWQRDRVCQALRMALADEAGAKEYAREELEKLMASTREAVQ